MEQAHREFVELKHAYDTLIEPTERIRYFQQHQHHGHQHSSWKSNSWNSQYNHSYTHGHQGYDEKRSRKSSWKSDYQNSEFFRRANRRRAARSGKSEMEAWGTDAYEQFKQELEEALRMAYEGPQFSSSKEQPFPENFEIEERSFKKFHSKYEVGMDINQIVSGRHHLGSIVQVENMMLSEDHWDKGKPVSLKPFQLMYVYPDD